jgi:hypothetical protein
VLLSRGLRNVEVKKKRDALGRNEGVECKLAFKANSPTFEKIGVKHAWGRETHCQKVKDNVQSVLGHLIKLLGLNLHLTKQAPIDSANVAFYPSLDITFSC